MATRWKKRSDPKSKALQKRAASKSSKPVVLTYCDFGTPGRRTVIGRHFSLTSAHNQYKRLWDIYHRLHHDKVWQEVQ